MPSITLTRTSTLRRSWDDRPSLRRGDGAGWGQPRVDQGPSQGGRRLRESERLDHSASSSPTRGTRRAAGDSGATTDGGARLGHAVTVAGSWRRRPTRAPPTGPTVQSMATVAEHGQGSPQPRPAGLLESARWHVIDQRSTAAARRGPGRLRQSSADSAPRTGGAFSGVEIHECRAGLGSGPRRRLAGLTSGPPSARGARRTTRNATRCRPRWCGCRRRWPCSGRGARRRRRTATTPRPRGSSNETTTPRPAPRGTPASAPGAIAAEPTTGDGSVDDLGDRELDDVGGAGVLERGDQRVDRGTWRRRSRPRSRAPPSSSLTVGDFIDGQEVDDARRGRSSATLSFTSTLPRASSTPVEQRLQLLHRVALLGVGVRRPGWRSARCRRRGSCR